MGPFTLLPPGLILTNTLALPRPSRPIQLPCHPIIHHNGPRHIVTRPAPKRTNIRINRRVARGNVPLQVPEHIARSQAQARRISVLLPHARNASDKVVHLHICHQHRDPRRPRKRAHGGIRSTKRDSQRSRRDGQEPHYEHQDDRREADLTRQAFE